MPNQVFFATGTLVPWVVPIGIRSLFVVASGGDGGHNNVGDTDSGKGVTLKGTLMVVPGETLSVQVGKAGGSNGPTASIGTRIGGYPDGGNGGFTSTYYHGGGGGGSTRIWRGGTLLAMCGGGGGAGGWMSAGLPRDVGDASEPGKPAWPGTHVYSLPGGFGATPSAGGAGSGGTNGGYFVGGNGQGGTASRGGGGGGGGGYYGGGGGAQATFVEGSGGGGGTSYISGSPDWFGVQWLARLGTALSYSSGYNGQVIFTYGNEITGWVLGLSWAGLG